MTVRRWVVLLSLLAILVLAAAVALQFRSPAAPDYLASEYVKEFFLGRMERNLGRKVEVGTMQLHVFPKIKLELVDLTVRDVDPSHVFLKAKRAEVVLRLWPLFFGEVVTKRLKVDEPTFVLRRDRQGQWNFLTAGPSGEALDKSVGFPLSRLLLLRELAIRNGDLAIIDEGWPDGIRSVRLQALDVAVQAQPRQRQADLYISAILVGSTGTSSLTLAGTLTQTQSQIQIAQETAEGIIPAFQFEGAAEATNLPLRELASFIGPQPIPEEVKGAVNLRGHIRLVPGVVGYDMMLTDLTAKVKHVAFSGQATLSGLMTAQPTLALTFSSSQIQVNELFDIIPARWIHTQLPELIAKWDIRGTLEVVTATLTGVVTPEPRLSLTGELRVHEGYAVVGESGTVVENVFSTILLEPDRIRAIELSGMYGTMRVDAGKAMVSFFEAGPWLELELKGEMAAADLLAQVNIGDLLQSKQVAKAWKGWHDVRGVTLLGFRISGPLNRPREIQYVGAEFEALDVSFGTSLLPGRVTGLNGRLVIADKEIELDSLRGMLEQTDFELQGRITGDKKNAYHDFVITTRGRADELVQFFTLAVPSKLPPLGTVTAVVGLSGPLAAPKFKGRLDLDDTAWTFPGLGRKPRGRQAAIEFDGVFGKRAVPILHRIEVVLPSLRVSGRGNIRVDKHFRINAAIGLGPIAVTLLPDWMRPKGLERGELEISLDVRGKGRDWSAWQITGWVAVTDGVISLPGLDSAVRDVNLRLKLAPNRAELKHLTFRILDSEARLAGVIRRWQTKPSMTLAIDASHFDLELLIPRRKDSPVKKFFTDLAASTRVTATAKLKRGTYKLLSLLDLSCRVNIADGVIDLDRITGKSLPGQVDGRIIIRLPRRQAGSIEAVWRVAGLPFQDFHSLFSHKDSPVSGDLFFTGSLRGHGKAPRGVHATLNGRTDLRIEKGRFLKDDSRAIWKILSALSLPALLRGKVNLDKDGFPFDEITAIMVVQDGRVSSDNIIVDSPVVKMTAAGSYDIPTDQLNYVVAVSPLGPYGSLLGRIPLFGKLIKGERKGLATALFDVKGSIHDPQVIYRPLKSFTSGLAGIAKLAVDVLVNIVTLPKELIAPSEDGEPQVDQVPKLSEPASP